MTLDLNPLALSPMGTKNGFIAQARNTQNNSATEPPAKSDTGSNMENEQQQQRIIAILKKRDRQVRNHEMAHLSQGGQHTGGVRYSYQTGPDGVRYAVSGEVSVDTSPVPGDPQATLEKSRKIRAAALAPSDPSPTDHSIAAEALKLANQARQELQQQKRIEQALSAYGQNAPNESATAWINTQT